MQLKHIALLGSGGFGDVWLCEDDQGRKYAKKVLYRSTDKDAVSRFRREVRILSELSHPHIVRIITANFDAPPFWYVMPLFQRSLEDELPTLVGDSNRISVIFQGILDGVDHAHKSGVVHRDLKSANVLMNSDTDLAVSDFGVSRQMDSESTRDTVTGLGLGSLYYMAPEQFRDAKNGDTRSDVYALGRLLYELHTGCLSDFSQDLTILPEMMAIVVEVATQKDPELRYPTVSHLRSGFLIARRTDLPSSLLSAFRKCHGLDLSVERNRYRVYRFIVRTQDSIETLFGLDPVWMRHAASGLVSDVASKGLGAWVSFDVPTPIEAARIENKVRLILEKMNDG